MTKEKEHNDPKQKRPLWNRILRIFLKFLAVLILLFIILVLVVRSEWGQNLIVSKAVNYVFNKTNTKVDIEKLFITFDGDIQIDGLYLEDKKGDTLVYSKSLEAGIPLWEAINGNIGNDVYISNCSFIDENFHARFNARVREYHYLITGTGGAIRLRAPEAQPVSGPPEGPGLSQSTNPTHIPGWPSRAGKGTCPGNLGLGMSQEPQPPRGP